MRRDRFAHAISLLVHEGLEVVVDQCRNFERFAPRSLIMIHVSASATFGKEALGEALAAAGCARCRINPVSRASAWGNIIHGHFANVAALAGLLDGDGTVSLHASNDMLLRTLPDFAGPGQARYQARPVSTASVWYTGRQFARSAAFGELLAALGCGQAVGGQIEGSVYPLALLRALADAVQPHEALLAALPMVIEEILFPTWAVHRLGPPAACPYILFRPTRIPAAGVRAVPAALRGSRAVDRLQAGLNRLVAPFTSPDARPADVDAIIAGRPLRVADWAQGMAPAPAQRFLGIKRIARVIDDPLRVRIRRHTAAAASAA